MFGVCGGISYGPELVQFDEVWIKSNTPLKDMGEEKSTTGCRFINGYKLSGNQVLSSLKDLQLSGRQSSSLWLLPFDKHVWHTMSRRHDTDI